MEQAFSQNFPGSIRIVKSGEEAPMKSMAAILVTVVVSLLIYKYYFGKAESDGA